MDETVAAALKRHGLRADKAFGQHFLLDPSVLSRIAQIAGPLESRPILEVGPGPGGLTRALLEAGAGPVVAVERDARFAPVLAEIADAYPGRLHVHMADALKVEPAALLGAAGAHGPAAIVANLPYNVATPLLVGWLKAGAWRGPMTLMFQKEVAQRIAARPGEPAYGRLAVLAQSRCTAQIALTLPAGAFTPPPKVASAVVRLDDRPDPFDDLPALETVTAAAFGQRRKMLRSALKALPGGLDPEALLKAAGLAPTARAETIPISGFQALAHAWREATGRTGNRP